MLDNFREWLSDNLRYILLGLAILVVLVVLFFGIKALTGGSSDKEKEPDTTKEQQHNTDKEDNSKVSADSSTKDEKKEDENSLEKNAYPEVNSLIDAFYTAWGQKNVDRMKELTDSFDATDEAKVLNAAYIESYNNINVYTKKGLTEDSYVVFVSYDLKFADVATPAPGLTQLYVKKNDSGKFMIHNDSGDSEINEFMDKTKQEDDVKDLIKEVETNLNKAMEDDADLKAFEEQLGQETNMASLADNGSVLTTQDTCNMRSEASTDSEVLKQLEAGVKVTKVDNAADNWIKVEYNGQTGYIFGDLLQ